MNFESGIKTAVICMPGTVSSGQARTQLAGRLWCHLEWFVCVMVQACFPFTECSGGADFLHGHTQCALIKAAESTLWCCVHKYLLTQKELVRSSKNLFSK